MGALLVIRTNRLLLVTMDELRAVVASSKCWVHFAVDSSSDQNRVAPMLVHGLGRSVQIRLPPCAGGSRALSAAAFFVSMISGLHWLHASGTMTYQLQVDDSPAPSSHTSWLNELEDGS